MVLSEKIASLVVLKNVNPNLKINVAIGGWNAGVSRFQRMTATISSRATFINSLMAYMQKHGLDGFDLDWEYPALSDKDNLSALMKISQLINVMLDKHTSVCESASS